MPSASKHSLPMTFQHSSTTARSREGLPFFAGEQVIRPNGKPGKANDVVMRQN